MYSFWEELIFYSINGECFYKNKITLFLFDTYVLLDRVPEIYCLTLYMTKVTEPRKKKNRGRYWTGGWVGLSDNLGDCEEAEKPVFLLGHES